MWLNPYINFVWYLLFGGVIELLHLIMLWYFCGCALYSKLLVLLIIYDYFEKAFVVPCFLQLECTRITTTNSLPTHPHLTYCHDQPTTTLNPPPVPLGLLLPILHYYPPTTISNPLHYHLMTASICIALLFSSTAQPCHCYTFSLRWFNIPAGTASVEWSSSSRTHKVNDIVHLLLFLTRILLPYHHTAAQLHSGISRVLLVPPISSDLSLPRSTRWLIAPPSIFSFTILKLYHLTAVPFV